MNKAVFIDRDGVINNDEGHYYIYRVEDFKINTDIVAGFRMLQEAGFKLIIVTNQGGVAKGEYTEDAIQTVHNHLQEVMQKHKVSIDAIYYCPHHDSVSPCDCRKPKPGMILRALEEHEIDPEQSFLIGDSKRDIEAGEAAGLKACFKIAANSSILPACQQILDSAQ